MKAVTTRVDSDTHAAIDERAEDTNQSKSVVARELIRRGLDYDSLKAERDDLRRQLREVNAWQDDVTEYVEEERAIQRRREERENASAWRRAKHWVVGYDDEEMA